MSVAVKTSPTAPPPASDSSFTFAFCAQRGFTWSGAAETVVPPARMVTEVPTALTTPTWAALSVLKNSTSEPTAPAKGVSTFWFLMSNWSKLFFSTTQASAENL